MSKKTLSQELGTPLDRTDYTLEEIEAKIQRSPESVGEGLTWTREYWKWFLPKHDDGSHEGYNPNIWYEEAIRKLLYAIVGIGNNIHPYEEGELDEEYAGLIATAFEFYETQYHHLKKGPEAPSETRKFS